LPLCVVAQTADLFSCTFTVNRAYKWHSIAVRQP